jgi:hypothetical protein
MRLQRPSQTMGRGKRWTMGDDKEAGKSGKEFWRASESLCVCASQERARRRNEKYAGGTTKSLITNEKPNQNLPRSFKRYVLLQNAWVGCNAHCSEVYPSPHGWWAGLVPPVSGSRQLPGAHHPISCNHIRSRCTRTQTATTPGRTLRSTMRLG